MGFFRRTPKAAEPAGPAPAQMRGRAAEITDAGVFGWEVIWEALKTEPPDDDAETITQELGLRTEREIHQTYGSIPATEFSGTRHGRPVALRIGVVPGIRNKGFNEVQLSVAVPSFRLGVADGRPAADASGAPPAVEEALSALAPAPDIWRQLEVEAGPEGLIARRPVTAHSQGYVYDLWLLERLADRLDA